MDAKDLNRALLSQFETVCRHLLPNGKVEGNHYCVGGLDGSPGKSLQITLSGAAAGRYMDFANKEDKGASPLWLWHKTKGISFKEAIKEAKAFLNLPEDDDYGIKKHKAKEWQLPAPADRNGTRLAEPNTKVMDYLTLERRLDPIVIAKAKIGESKDGEWVVIPYFEADEKDAFHIKKLKVDRVNGKKEMFASRDTRRSLYGKHLIDDNVSELTLCEGEVDCLSWHSYSIPAVSVPNGVSDFAWVEVDWDWLERFERINVCMDDDEPGRIAAKEICNKLGLHRCFIVTLPKKDTNDCLVGGVPRDEMVKCLAEAKAIDLDEIKHPDDYTDEVHDYYTVDWSQRGWSTPWYPQLPWRVRKAELTILSGFSGSGKTVALNQLMLHLVQQGVKVMDASLEIKPGMTLYNMTRCALGKKKSTREEIDGCISWLNDSVYFLDCIGTVNTKRLISAFNYARKRHGIDVFIIDSLFKCGLDPADYGAQRTFADELTTFCNNTGAHVILVAHSRKTQNGNEHGVPSKSDISGSSDLANAAFNVLIWWRNKLKKLKLDELRQSPMPDLEAVKKWMDAPDGCAVLDKQRFGEGEEAKVNMFFAPESFQFHTTPNKKIPYFVVR